MNVLWGNLPEIVLRLTIGGAAIVALYYLTRVLVLNVWWTARELRSGELARWDGEVPSWWRGWPL